jgi:hypothetical protein
MIKREPRGESRATALSPPGMSPSVSGAVGSALGGGRSKQPWVAVALVLAFAAGASALPAGAITQRFETGWHLTAGAGYSFDERVGLRLDYTHTRERLVGTALPPAFVEGQHRVHGLELDLRWTLNPAAPASVALLAGPGLYRRQTEITSVSDYTPGPSICDPWLQVCAEGPVPSGDILGSRASTEPGFNLGAVVDIPIWRSARFFIELRWRFVWGDTYGLPGDPSQRSSSSYFPLSFGLSF